MVDSESSNLQDSFTSCSSRSSVRRLFVGNRRVTSLYSTQAVFLLPPFPLLLRDDDDEGAWLRNQEAVEGY